MSLLELSFRHRSVLLLLPVSGVLLAALSPGPLDLSGMVAGGVVVLLGCALRLWAVRAIGKRARVRRPGAKELLVVGPYAHVRNPLYLANSAVAAGLAAAGGAGTWALLVLAGCLAIYALVVHHEESVLAQTFGAAYDAYRAAVPRWFPRPSPAPRTHEEVVPWPWPEVLRREVGLVIGSPLALIGIWAVRTDLAPLRSFSHARALAVAALVVAGFANLISTEVQLRRHQARRGGSGDAPS